MSMPPVGPWFQDSEEASKRLIQIGEEEQAKAAKNEVKGGIWKVKVLRIHLEDLCVGEPLKGHFVSSLLNHSLGDVNPNDLASCGYGC